MQVFPPKKLNLLQLRQELIAAGIQVPSLGSSGVPTSEVHTYDQSGSVVDLPTSAQAIVDAHIAQDDPAIVERDTAKTDLQATAQQARDRLNQLATSGQAMHDRLNQLSATPPSTNAQVIAAVQDLARFQEAVAVGMQDVARIVDRIIRYEQASAA